MAIKKKKKKETYFSSDELETVRRFTFTNPHGDTSLVYPQELLTAEELSPLTGAVSRTHLGMQERALRFLDKDKRDQTRELLPHIPELMRIFRDDDGSLKQDFKTAAFNREWPLAHGHNSLKEETNVFGHVENISDIGGKKITGHPLNHPQVKSSRYISFGKTLDLSLEDEDLRCLPEEGTLASISIEDVGKLAASALEIFQKIPKGGADKELARSILVRDLAPVFERVTGRKPGRSFDTTAHKKGDRGGRGQFFRFCLEVLDCFLPGAEKGLDDVIKLTLRNMG